MPQIKILVQDEQVETGVTGATYGDPISLSGALTLCAQCTISSASTPGSATALIQTSADPEDETPSNWNTLIASQAVSTNGPLLFEKVNPAGNWARIAFAISSGSFTATTQFIVKGMN